MYFLTRNKPYWLLVLIILGCCVLYYNKLVFLYPAYMHDWAQSDRLSLAINFYDKGMNFFKPATHNLYSVDGITGVEFPVQSYMAALMGYIFGREHISICFRVLDILISFTGLFFLFHTCYRATKDFILSVLPPLFLFCSPVFVFYTGTYIPDTAATSVAFIGFYYVFRYLEQPSDKTLLTTILLFTLATLIKTSLGYCLIAFGAISLIKHVRSYKEYRAKHRLLLVAAMVITCALVIAYYFYNAYLNKEYNSTLFLARTAPFKDWASLQKYYYKDFLAVWMDDYFLVPQYFMMALLLLPTVYVSASKMQFRYHLLFFILLVAGSASLFYLFGMQIIYHDYYIISILQPTVAFLLLLSVVSLHDYLKKQIVLLQACRFLLMIAIGCFVYMAHTALQERMQPQYMNIKDYGITWAARGRVLLDSLQIPKHERIAVLDEDAPNRALVHLDRRGYHIPRGTWVGDMGKTNDILNDLRVRILVCNGQLGASVWKNDVSTVWFFEPLYMDSAISVFRKKRLPPLPQP